MYFNNAYGRVLIAGLVLFGYSNTSYAQQFTTTGPTAIKRFGPVDPANGYPIWAEDADGTIMELCFDTSGQVDPLDPLVPCPTCIDPELDLPDPLSPISFPDNFPEEAFYFACGGLMSTNNGGGALLVLALEAAFDGLGTVQDGEQIVFNRLRIRIDNATGGASYTITHPYGTVTVVADGAGPRGINISSDIFLWKGQELANPLRGNFGVFPTVLDAVPDARFLGDFCGENQIDTNNDGVAEVFRIEGPNIGEAGSPNLCADYLADADPLNDFDCIEVNTFALLGKFATRIGAGIDRATYVRDATSTQINVWASSSTGQTLELSGAGLPTTPMVADGTGNYFAHIVEPSGFIVPATVTVTNTTDFPIQSSVGSLSDNVIITDATYNYDAQTLTIQANSSDSTVTGSSLSLGGSALDASGFAQITGVVVPPSSISIDSSSGGSTSSQVVVVGAVPDVIAVAGGTYVVATGSAVLLDGSGSVGLSLTYNWIQGLGTPVTLTGANTATPSFTFPASSDLLTFTMTVTDANGISSSDIATVTNTVVAIAGADQVFATYPDTGVTIDASASVGAQLNYSWVQTTGPAATLDNPNSAVANFAFPLEGGTIIFEVTVSGPGGISSDSVSITAPVGAPIANAGPDQSVFSDELVQLDGGASAGLIDTYSWTAPVVVTLGCLQTDGSIDTSVACNLNIPDPAFIFPGSPGTLTFSLVVTGPGGSSAADSVDITAGDPVGADELNINRAEYKSAKGEWRIDGTSSIPGPGHTVTVYLDSLLESNVIGIAAVDAIGDWRVQCRTDNCPDPNGDESLSLLVKSTLGGTLNCSGCYSIK